MIYEKLYLLIVLILLVVFSYVIIEFKKFKYAYNLLIGIINIWCISVFSYLIIENESINVGILIGLIYSFIFQFDHYFPKSKVGKLFSIGIVWFFTIIACISCFSGMGALILFFIQPISYLFSFYLLKNKIENISFPIYVNLIITWGFFALIASWELTH